MIFQPYPTRSGFVALALAALLGALAIWLTKLLLQTSELYEIFELLTGLILVLVLLGIVLYWALIAFKLHYGLNRNGITVGWGLAQQRIPFSLIQEIIPGNDLSTSPTFRGINAAGLRLGKGELAGLGPLRFYTTATLVNSLVIVTPQQAYVISPRRPEELLKAWRVRQSLGPTQEWLPEFRRNWPAEGSVLADPLGRSLLGLAALVCFTLFGYLSLILPQLPPSIPIHFNAFGRADRIADKTSLFVLLAVGALVLLVNAILGSLTYRWEKLTAYLLWGSTLVLQACLWVAVLMITA